MRLYLEPSVLVKIFKREEGSNKMIEILSRMDRGGGWFAHTSSWTILEVARALKKDGKPKELIEFNLKELRSHKIAYHALTREVLSEAERMVAGYNLYASDAVHAATFRILERASKVDGFLTDDRHFHRLQEVVATVTVQQMAP